MAMNMEQSITELARLMRLAQTLTDTEEADSALLIEALDALDGAKSALNRIFHEMHRLSTATLMRHQIKVAQEQTARITDKVGA